MLDFFADREYFIDRIWFYYNGSLYSGNGGFMTWNHDRGFYIAARVARSKPPPKEEYIDAISFKRGPSIRMKLEDGTWAFAPRAPIDDLDLSFRGHVSLDLHRLIFMQALGTETHTSFWSGSALMETSANLVLPDSVKNETRIGEWEPSWRLSRTGLHYEDDSGQLIIGELRDKTHLYIHWDLPYLDWTKSDSWRLADGLQDAISIASGEIARLRYHEMQRGRRVYTEMRARNKASSLGMTFRLFDQDKLDKNMIVRVASFLAHGGKDSDICRRIFWQIVDASHQSTRQGSELLLATILEAALRSLYNYPFEPGKSKRKDAFRLERSVMTFHKTYLVSDVETGRKWKKIVANVIKAQRRLRDRNAHPDWLLTPGGAYSPIELMQSTNDLMLLSRFYGYIILALAGFKGLQPKFPTSIDSWPPYMIVRHDVTQAE